MKAFLFLAISILSIPMHSFLDAQEVTTWRTVVVFGDSITEGNMLPADQRSRVWVHLVEEQSQGRLHLINEGKGGRPTNSVKEFKAALQRDPQMNILVLALGMNDSRDIRDDCVPKAVKNIQEMIDLARTAHEKLPILIIGPSNIRKDALKASQPVAAQRDEKLRQLGAAFQNLATQNGCDFLSLYGVVPESSLGMDGVHPDGAGNEIIAQAILPKILASAGK
jgi:acyl-CoA thioesterase-1